MTDETIKSSDMLCLLHLRSSQYTDMTKEVFLRFFLASKKCANKINEYMKCLFSSFKCFILKAMITKFILSMENGYQENMYVKCIPPYTTLLYRKTGVCSGKHIFLIFASKHRLWVCVRTTSQIVGTS